MPGTLPLEGARSASSAAAAADTPALDGSRSRVIGLRYSLSYVKLFEITFRALDDPRPFNPDYEPIDEVEMPVREVPEHYDVVTVRHQPLKARVAVIKRLPQALRYAPRQLLHFYTDLRQRPEGVFGSMSSKTRSTVVRKVRNYEKFCGGTIHWRMYKTPE
jgi:hypothetical protein